MESINNTLEQKDLCRIVREHKHNYARDFGNVVCLPADSLFDEMIENPSAYSIYDKQKIIEVFKRAVRSQAIYEFLGFSVEEQMHRIEETIIPMILANSEEYKSILQDVSREYHNIALVEILKRSLNQTKECCETLKNFDTLKHGNPEVFNLRSIVLQPFDEYNKSCGLTGNGIVLTIDRPFRYENTRVFLPKDDFQKYVLQNIISNIKDHAFVGNDFHIQTHTSPQKKVCIFKKLINSFSKNHILQPIRVPMVRIRFNHIVEKNDIQISISNNGVPFCGNPSRIFDLGVGSGSGIGLWSAKHFLEQYNGSIQMISHPDQEFPVEIIITLPIYDYEHE